MVVDIEYAGVCFGDYSKWEAANQETLWLLLGLPDLRNKCEGTELGGQEH